MNIPDDLHYTSDHEWVALDGDHARVGITDFAQEALGDVVFVELPKQGTRVERGAMLGEVESTKSVSEIYAPLSGSVAEVNTELADTPERLNSDPYGGGWLCVIAVADPTETALLLGAEQYRDLTTS